LQKGHATEGKKPRVLYKCISQIQIKDLTKKVFLR
jgi:hypothetical protein